MTNDAPDLTPQEGLSNVWIEVDGVDTFPQSTSKKVRFRISLVKPPGPDQQLAVLSFHIHNPKGWNDACYRASDELVAMLRQMLWQADNIRTGYKTAALRQNQE
jgi:hypothetical protein